jgi:hypothetical protein
MIVVHIAEVCSLHPFDLWLIKSSSQSNQIKSNSEDTEETVWDKPEESDKVRTLEYRLRVCHTSNESHDKNHDKNTT